MLEQNGKDSALGRAIENAAGALKTNDEVSPIEYRLRMMQELICQLRDLDSELSRRMDPVLLDVPLTESSAVGGEKDSVCELDSRLQDFCMQLQCRIAGRRGLLERIQL